MNSENETSPTSPNVPNSSTLSQPVPSPTEDFDSEPLVGLLPRGQELSEDQIREHVINLRQMRQSFQTYKATMEASEKDKPKKEKKVSLDDMAGLIGL